MMAHLSKQGSRSLTGAKARVSRRRQLRDAIIELELEVVDEDAPAWEPGAHIDLCFGEGVVRQYSLCGDPGESTYRVAILREEAGRGGSALAHASLHEGAELIINGPRNHFELVDAPSYVFVAGGIGITAILPMIGDAIRRARPWVLFYVGRSRSNMAYVPEVQALVEASEGAGVALIMPKDETGRLDLAEVVEAAEQNAPVYVCGPESLLSALEDRVGDGLELGQLHLERFGASGLDTAADDGGLDNFEVEIASTGQVLKVGPDDRLLDVVRELVPHVPVSCEEGVCGSCETGVLGGLPCHRDLVLSEDERAANDCMMICVGRSLSPRLVLDL